MSIDICPTLPINLLNVSAIILIPYATESVGCSTVVRVDTLPSVIFYVENTAHQDTPRARFLREVLTPGSA